MGEKTTQNSQIGRMVLPTLFFSRFITGIPGIISGLLLIEIGNTFGSSIGITGQITAASSILRVAGALVMGVLSVRYSHKHLMMAGLVLYIISAIGSSLAINLVMLILFFTLTGPAFSIINPMTSTIVGETFPKEKRTTAIGWLIAGASTSYVVGAQIASRLAGIGGWKLTFLGFMVPISILGFVLTGLFIPKGKASQDKMGRGISSKAFKAVLFQRSATACLLGTLFRMSAFTVILSYAVSFLRQQFLISRDFASVVLTIIALSYTVGTLITGRFVNKFGRKMIASIALALASVFVIIYNLSNTFWLALSMVVVSTWFYGMSVSAGQSLNLEQVPEFRGTMMSFTSAFGGIGSTLGAGIGGYVLLISNWGTLGVVFGLLGIFGALTMFLYATDL